MPTEEIKCTYVCGLDLGKRHDPAVLSILQVRTIRTLPISIRMIDIAGRLPMVTSTQRMYVLKTLKRWALGTSYVTIAADVASIMANPNLQPDGVHKEGSFQRPLTLAPADPSLVVDATGVGESVIDYLKSLHLQPVPIVFTSGETQHYTNVPKQDIIDALQMAMAKGEFKISKDLATLSVFHKELQNFRASRTGSGRTTMAAVTGHDDTVFSTALGVWFAEQEAKKPVFLPNRSFNIYAR